MRQQYLDTLRREGRLEEIEHLQAMTDPHWYNKERNFTASYGDDDMLTCMCERVDGGDGSTEGK